MRNFRTYQLAVKFYHQVTELPLPGWLHEQLVRSASSIVLNLAEGRGRSTPKDQLRFFHTAMGSLRESQAGLEIAGFAESAAAETADRLGGHLYRLIQHAA